MAYYTDCRQESCWFWRYGNLIPTATEWDELWCVCHAKYRQDSFFSSSFFAFRTDFSFQVVVLMIRGPIPSARATTRLEVASISWSGTTRAVVMASRCGSSLVEVFRSIFPRMNHSQVDGAHPRLVGQLRRVTRLISSRIMSSYLILHYGILHIFCVIRPIIRWTYALCSGDWAGASSVWNSTNQNGQTGGSCASRTGYSTCVDFVRGQGAAFAEAYWEVGSVKFYQWRLGYGWIIWILTSIQPSQVCIGCAVDCVPVVVLEV